MRKKRLDRLLVERGLAPDLKKAAALIMSGRVLVDGQRISQPGTPVAPGQGVQLLSPRRPFVSRGGVKLQGALRHFQIPVQDRICLDLGASTGGFTDCLLQSGARRVYALDVGRGQLDWSLRQDPRVVVRDNVNVRHLEPDWIPERVDLICIDLSFISLRSILPRLLAFPGSQVLALVKPQFEAEREEVTRGGIIPDEKLQQQIVWRVAERARELGLSVRGCFPSPIRGRKGNQEYFLWLSVPPG